MKRFPYYFLFLLALAASHTVLGAETAPSAYTPLVGVPGIESGKVFSTEQYVSALYYLSITVAGLLAVVQIIYGGVEWTFSDAFTEKSNAKTRIQGALLGLLIVLSAVLILNTLNTNLTTLNIFGNAPKVDPITTGSVSQPVKTSCILPSACTASEVFVRTSAAECGRCESKEIANETTNIESKTFNYSSVNIVNGSYTINTALLDKLDPVRILDRLEAQCIPQTLSNPSIIGGNTVYKCK
jgi:hypothetical protein